MTATPTAPAVEDTEWRGRAAALAEHLAAIEVITDPVWKAAFGAVPRHAFVPRWWALNEYNAIDHLIDGDDPTQCDTWLDGAYADRPLITRWEPGDFGGTPVRIATSSVSQPYVVATLLDRLRPRPGDRVLEIGTGSGYNAALLCHRLGDSQVTSVDLDPELVDAARTRLAAIGMHPSLHAGDGLTLPGEPGSVDRIVATCAVSRIPTAWSRLLAPGGRIVAPMTFAGALAVLDRTGPTTLRGRIDPCQVRFMSLRAPGEAAPATTAPAPPDPDPQRTHAGTTDLDPARLDDPDFALWLAAHDLHLRVTATMPGAEVAFKLVYTATVRASVTPAGPGRWQVHQQGGRPWDTVEAAWRSFERAGQPTRSDIELTVDTENDTQYLGAAGGDNTRFPLEI